jgi:NAD+ synthase (glutamine-hydrolysing)
MKLIRVAAAVLNQTPLDWEGNRTNILDAIERARKDRVSVLCLPELCITGYGCEDAFQSRGVVETAWKLLGELVPKTKGMAVSFGLPVLHRDALIDAACLAVDGRIVGFVGKRHLAGDGIHYEPRWFKPWPQGVQSELAVAGERFPLGDLCFECDGVRIGFEICEDAWVAKRPGGDMALEGVDILLNPSASHFAFGKHEIRKRFVLEGSRAFGVGYVYSNLVGNEAGRTIYDGCALIASEGRLVAQGPRFSFAPVAVVAATIDVDANRTSRTRTSSFTPNLAGKPADAVHADFRFPEIQPDRSKLSVPAWETGSRVKEEEFTRAVALGLFDYLRKSRSGGFVVSLSGGADSSAVSTLVALMVWLGLDELGRETFGARLAAVPGLSAAKTPAETVRALLTCVYQATENSSQMTREAARRVAEALGADFLEFDVDRLVKEYVAMVSAGVKRPITWKTDDIALQNIQARVRGPGPWMLANLRNALLLATSDRSEAAVGYATMDGDTSGGLSPIAGVDKAFLRQWLRWLEKEGPWGLQAIPALAVVTAQSPTPELRPQSAGQTAESDLMPYEILDAIERAAIRDKLVPVEVFKQMRAQFPDRSQTDLANWVRRFFRLWARNQWKRERYAPCFHVDDENLDPKTWCRFPILSGGFERELAELDQYLREQR